MRARAIIHVSGPEGSGKTAFIEALIHAFDESDVACVRGFADVSVRKERESSPKQHPELKRWRRAGASAVALYRFDPRDATAADGFFLTDIMENYSKMMVIEGDCPLEYVDLVVFVARLPRRGASILCRVTRDIAADRRALVESFVKTMADADDRVGASGKLRMDPAVMESLLQHYVGAPRTGAPAKKWQLAAGYAGIENAGLVIGNLHSPDEQPQAAPFLDEVARLRRDKAKFDDVIGWRGGRVPITAVVGSVLDPKDAGLKKALARVKRAVRSVG
jgi:hypothetical protein